MKFILYDTKIIPDLLKDALTLYLSGIQNLEIAVPGRINVTIEFPTLKEDYFILKERGYRSGRLKESTFEHGVYGTTAIWEEFEMYCGGKNGRKTKVRRRVA
ncbi:MAG: hypothetical protein WC523_05035 [Patescibacteria group bacterium]